MVHAVAKSSLISCELSIKKASHVTFRKHSRWHVRWTEITLGETDRFIYFSFPFFSYMFVNWTDHWWLVNAKKARRVLVSHVMWQLNAGACEWDISWCVWISWFQLTCSAIGLTQSQAECVLLTLISRWSMNHWEFQEIILLSLESACTRVELYSIH